MSLLRKMNNSLSGRAFIYTVGNFVLGASNFLASAIFVRMMSTSDYGLASVYITWVALVSQIIGLRIEGTIQNAKLTYGKECLRAYCSSVLFLDLVVFLVVLVLSIILIEPVAFLLNLDQGVWLLAVITAFFLTCSNLRKCYCSAIKNAPGDLLISCILAFAQIGLSVLLIWLSVCGNSYLDRVWGYSVPTVAVGVGVCAFFFFKGKRFIAPKQWKFCLSFSIPMIFNGIAYLVINQSDRLMLNSMVGPDTAGIYSFVYNIALPISVITQSLGAAWQPEYYELKAQGDEGALKTHARRYTSNVLIITVILMCVSPEILKLLGTQDYYSGLVILPVVIAGYFFQFLYTWPLNCEFYHRNTVGIALATLVAAAFNIALNIFLIPIWGMVGSAVATCAAFVLLFVMHHISARIMVDEYTMTLKWFAPYVITCVCATAALTFLVDMLAARWVLSLVLCVLLVVRFKKNRSII